MSSLQLIIDLFAAKNIPLSISKWDSPFCFMQIACNNNQPLPLIFIGDACRECWMLQQEWKREDEYYERMRQ